VKEVIRLLVVDHDDTAVASSRSVHYPAHRKLISELRPGMTPLSFEAWYEKNFDPGFAEYLKQDLGLDERETKRSYKIWRSFADGIVPDFFDGMLDLLQRFRKQRGAVVVVSHSESDVVRANYEAKGQGFLPDAIHGWNPDPTRRKPDPELLRGLMQEFESTPETTLVVDDLKPGIDMGLGVGAMTAAAGWAHDIPVIEDYMRRVCDAYLHSVAELSEFIFGET
jgi:phosphoglycolate phosphatase/pyrophosphatase PpaX